MGQCRSARARAAESRLKLRRKLKEASATAKTFNSMIWSSSHVRDGNWVTYRDSIVLQPLVTKVIKLHFRTKITSY